MLYNFNKEKISFPKIKYLYKKHKTCNKKNSVYTDKKINKHGKIDGIACIFYI